jgi:hypothetical protein
MKPFRHDGELRNRQQAEENIQASLEIIESSSNEKINDAVNKIRRIIPTLLNYFDIAFAEGYLQEKFEIIKERVYSELDAIVQSSAMVECINSVIRPYLNTSRGQVNQNILNLIAFYHNNRRYRAGKRANKTPMEILTGKKQEKAWTELLFDLIDEKDPQFFSAAS